MKIIELKLNDQYEDDGILAVSFVSHPAIEKDFIYFSKEDFLKRKGSTTPVIDPLKDANGNWKYWQMVTTQNQKPVLDNSHDFCREHAVPPKNIYTIQQINQWHTKPQAKYDLGWNTSSNFTQVFNGVADNYNLDQQIFNCRHYLTPIVDKKDLKKAGIKFQEDEKQTFQIDFSITNDEKRIIKGVVMIPNVLIYRYDHQKQQDYYVYFSKKTIKQLKEKYKWNRSITYQHQNNITGSAILMNSWLYEQESDDNCGIDNLKLGSWCMEYKIISNKLWESVKTKGVKGFSVELLLSDFMKTN